MELLIDFPGGDRVDAHFGGFTVMTDQPHADGSDPLAPSPFDTFLAALGTCAGIYVLGFCKPRGLPTQGLRIVQRTHRDPATGMVGKIDLEIQVPPGFPDKYLPALVRSAELCAVKKHIEKPPVFDVYTQILERA
jgi:ribosomal protein S12 methylthiotransferase accessory factor